MLLLLLLLPLVTALDMIKGNTQGITFVQLNGTEDINNVFEHLPKQCTKNGTKYEEGEAFNIGHLRYKCKKYGVYSIEGCLTDKNKEMKVGETLIDEHVAHQCLAKGNSIYYRMTVCGIEGQPDCDKVPLPEGYKKAMEKEKELPSGTVQKTVSKNVNLPPGWKIIEEVGRKIPGTNARVISRTLEFEPFEKDPVRRRIRESEFPKSFPSEGVGSVLEVSDDVGTDKPPMPMSMLMGGKQVGKEESNAVHHSPMSSNSMTGSHHTASKNSVSTQSVGANLHLIQKDEPMKAGTMQYKPGTVSGHRSFVDWKGKTINVNGQSIAAGPGTFTFGNKPTGGQFLRKEEDKLSA